MNKFFATILLLITLTTFAQAQTSQARAQLNYGDRYWASQRYNEAAPYYSEARRLAYTNPVDMQVLLSLTYRYLALRDERAAWDCFDKVTTYAYQYAGQNPDWSKGWLRESVNFYTQHLAGVGVMRQAGTSQTTITAFYNRAVWIQSFLAGNTTPNTGVTLAVSAQVVAPGSRLVVSFNAPGRAGKTQDWVSLYKAGATNQTYLPGWKHTGGQASGSFEVTAPNEAGRYEFRYLLDNGFTHVATSYSIEVRAAAPAYNARAIDWNYIPSEHRAKPGQRFAYTCSPGAASGRIWGAGVYTDDSSLCTAAVHAGMIRPATGGTVIIEMRAGYTSYLASASNGVTSLAYGGYPGSYVFVR